MEVSKTPRGPASFGVHSRGNGPFSAGFRNTIEDPGSKAAKVTCFTVHFGIPAGAARVRQHCRGCAHVGRCGPQTVRPGQKADGETRYFQKEGCSVLEREARSVFGPADGIEEVRQRIAGSP